LSMTRYGFQSGFLVALTSTSAIGSALATALDAAEVVAVLAADASAFSALAGLTCGAAWAEIAVPSNALRRTASRVDFFIFFDGCEKQKMLLLVRH
jgi:hypothetical protein